MPRHFRFHVLLTTVGMAGIALNFLPYVFDVVPVSDLLMDWTSWRNVLSMALPCMVLPIPVSVGYTIWLVKRRVPQWTVFAGYALSLLFALGIILDIATSTPYDVTGLLLGCVFLAAFAGTAWLAARGVKDIANIRALVAMQCIYAGPMALYLTEFAGDYQVGAWLGLLTLAAYLAQIGLLIKRPAWLLPVLVPLGCVVLLVMWIDWF